MIKKFLLAKKMVYFYMSHVGNSFVGNTERGECEVR